MRSRRALSFGLLLALAPLTALAAGCATENIADRQFAEMREQVTRLTADRDKEDERIAALAVPVAADIKPTADGSAAAPAGTPARSVQLGGPSDSDPADPNDTTPRPDIRVSGSGGGGGGGGTTALPRPRAGKSSARGRDDSDSLSDRIDTTRSSALDPEAKQSYETALALVQAKQYAKGLDGLNAFLVRWPDHPYAENAMYWRGEALFGQAEYLRAAEQFEAVLTRFGGGNKGPDALLKLGMCHDRLGSSVRARQYWDRLKTEFPRSDAAKRIPAAARDASPAKRAGSGDSSGSREDSSPKGPKENR